ncbi:MAG: hypothetical protein KatS3mg095_0043 [Candidatus Parcubacteria bacterium]|nr:MAG: hypothetical protein KatS3mg095_0043 [Candidatus Parcubacteria bacterium]
MKKILVYSFLIYLLTSLFLPIYIKGQELPPFDVDNPQAGVIEGGPRDTILKLFQIAFKILIWISLGFAVIFLAWGGILIIVKGDFGAGKNQIIYGIVGLVIALISWAVVNLISQFIQSGQLGQ